VLAVIVPEVVVQVNVSDDPGVTVGAVVFDDTVMLPVLVQPLAVLVTVTLYVPDAFTVGAADVPPLTMPGPLQEYEGLPALVETEMDPLVVEHVNVSGEPIVTVGGVVLDVTVTSPVAEHPLVVLVTVTVYVPAAFTVGVCVVPPLTMPGPLQE